MSAPDAPSHAAGPDESRFMRRALKIARKARGHVEPNPMVGCVIERGGQIISQGIHERFGSHHAEVNALRAAGSSARGSTVHVTLEPCPHFGKTPPCSRALIEAGVARVVVGTLDPHPERAGVGIAHLRQAGITVDMSPLNRPCRQLIAPFLKRSATGLPYVIAKWAATIDGSIATATGDSKWISSEKSRRLVHRLRSVVDAIIVGIGTALADDPLLTARLAHPPRTATRVVIDPDLRLPLTSQLVRTTAIAPLLIATASAQLGSQRYHHLLAAGAQIIGLPAATPTSRTLALEPLLRHLADAGATNVLLEGGGKTTGSFAQQNHLDELLIFVGPRLLGDSAACRPLLLNNPPTDIASAAQLRLVSARRLGPDALLRYHAGFNLSQV
jgi:diaminohydroxyphosphoribosylaminopyrimidine deaminase/5-amino-6-(5-phosphoribosylamino)uracil reductase